MRTDSAVFAQKNVDLAKDPRYVIELAFDSANTVLWYLTSHADAALPSSGVSGSILGVLEGLSGTSQTLSPDTANASIGNINFSLVDRLSTVTTTLGGQLALGRAPRKQRVRVYVGYQGLAWADYTLVQTQLVTEIAFSDGVYRFRCLDIQREMRKDIFQLAKTTLALTLAADATIVEVSDTTGFTTVAHGTSYSEAPSTTVGYIKIENEVIRYTGMTSTQFTGCTRGALNTRAVVHQVAQSTSVDRGEPVTEYVYLEMPAPKLMYALLTGVLHNQGGATLPVSWHLGIPTSYVRLADFTGIGTDLWDTADDQQGFRPRFEDLGKTDGKKFIETEVALLAGVFMPIYADGALGCKRMANILAGAAYVRQLDETNVVSYGDLVHDFGSLHNLLDVAWNWEPLEDGFTRRDVLLDDESIAIYKDGDPLTLAFRGLHGSRHSSAILKQRFDALRDRYSGPPIRFDVVVMPSLNALEVGDVVRVRLSNVRDYTIAGGGGPIDRSFEIQNVAIDWITGNVKLKLFASSRAPGAISPTSDAIVLTQAWYVGTGTALTVTGSNPGHISASVSLAGNADMNNAGAIYYYDGDLQIDAGVEVAISNNVQLRVKGFLQNNGTISGKGRGIAGAAAVISPTSRGHYNAGTQGFLGSTEAGGGIINRVGFVIEYNSIRGGSVVGRNASMPSFNLVWDGTILHGLPADLRGSSGSSGMPFTNTHAGDQFFPGGAGGNGGAGLAIICRGFSQGVAGRINLSGADGASMPSLPPSRGYNPFNHTVHAGSGAGGAPGGLLVLLDGAGVTATGLSEAAFVAQNGATPISGTQLKVPVEANPDVGIEGGDYYSYFVGTGDGTTFPMPSLSGARGGRRVQKVPKDLSPESDIPTEEEEVLLQELQVSNWTKRASPKNFSLNGVVWFNTKFVAVGNADGADALIITSDDGVLWAERANPKNFALTAIASSGTLLVAVGGADGADAYIVTSADGITWTERANPKNVQLNAVTWSSALGLWIAVGNADGADGYILTSPNGIVWTERANALNVQLRGVASSGSLVVAVGNQTGAAIAYILTSADGITWTARTNPMSAAHEVIFFPKGNLFIAGGDGLTNLATSPNGITWTLRANPKGNLVVLAFAASPQLIVAAGGTLGSAYVISSRNGTAWTEREINSATFALSAAYSGKRFVLVGDSAGGTDTLIDTSLAR